MLRAFGTSLIGLLVLTVACGEDSPSPGGSAGAGTSGTGGASAGLGGSASGKSGGGSSGAAGTAGTSTGGAAGSGTAGSSSGATSGGMSGSAGAGTGGNGNPGGTAGAPPGGSAGQGGSAGSAGSAGSGAATTGGTGGTSGGTAGAAGSGGTGSGNAALTDDFEGAELDATKWELSIADMAQSSIALSTEQHRSGSKSVKVVGNSGVTMFVNKSVFPLPAGVIHLRAWMFFTNDDWAGHSAFVAASPGAQSQEVRFGGQQNAYHANLAADGDGLTPDPYEYPDCPLCLAPVPDTWACIRGMFDFVNSDVTLYVGDTLAVDAESMDDWHSGSGTLPQNPTQIGFGWSLYGAAANTVYYDDIALGYEPIPCE